MEHSKIAIIGAGAVGSTTAYAIMMRNLTAEIMLVDIDEQRCKGEILDLSDSIPFSRTAKITQADAKQAGQADIIIIAAGAAQKPGQARTDLFKINQTILSSIIETIKPINNNAIIIMISNPVDLLTLHAQTIAGLPRNQIFGSGTFLDSQRLRTLISKKINISEQSIHAYILGEHGDTQFAAWSAANIAGVSIDKFSEITKNDYNEIAQQARNKAYEIISCKGATFFGIASCVAAICENIIFDKKRLLPLSCYQEEFNICLSMPVILGERGIEQIIPIPLDLEERALLEQSARVLQKAFKHDQS